jgi:hypothetical protein
MTLLCITTVNSELLHTIVVVQQMARKQNSARTKQSHAISFVSTKIVCYDMIFGMAWLQKQNHHIHWDTRVWHWHICIDADVRLIC